MYRASTEVIVGIFVILGVACLAYLSATLGEANLWRSPYYEVSAVFDSVSGLRKGAGVEIAGVEVGKVLEINLDQNQAKVIMGIQKGVAISDDTIASIRTQGIIGDKFIKLTPGGSSERIGPQGSLTETESAINIEELISKYIFEGKK
jgi:phospholipid/cholesterol/gamma-HCH transport system substrate-binding protein